VCASGAESHEACVDVDLFVRASAACLFCLFVFSDERRDASRAEPLIADTPRRRFAALMPRQMPYLRVPVSDDAATPHASRRCVACRYDEALQDRRGKERRCRAVSVEPQSTDIADEIRAAR